MNPNTWLEKAERLRSRLDSVRSELSADHEHMNQDPAGMERVTIARWLCEEFSGEVQEDTNTLPLFDCSRF